MSNASEKIIAVRIHAGFNAGVFLGGLLALTDQTGGMAGAYLLIAAVITVMNFEKIPSVLSTIVRCAYDFEALGDAGFALALMTDIKRGLFSNESGLGSAPIIAAAAKT